MKRVSKEVTKAVSKGQLKARLYEYCTALETDGGVLVVTDYGRPVLQITPIAKKDKEKETPAANRPTVRKSTAR